ncbi:MAG: hypothetical protein LCH20_02845 [Proteobacteria bacterium]|nr:hypothetical protein [Pseudomonadota bacterium]
MKILSKIKAGLKKVGHAFSECFGKIEDSLFDALHPEPPRVKLVGENYAVDIHDDNVNIEFFKVDLHL